MQLLGSITFGVKRLEAEGGKEVGVFTGCRDKCGCGEGVRGIGIVECVEVTGCTVGGRGGGRKVELEVCGGG